MIPNMLFKTLRAIYVATFLNSLLFLRTHAKSFCLRQSDFDIGTKIITEPGRYKLCEDITFAPHEPSITSSNEEIAKAFDPVAIGGDLYNTSEFSLGYFAAIVVASDDVIIDLNGYTIQQGASHALMQRFFAIIELASSPFIPNTGPANFVTDHDFIAAKNFQLKGPGSIGRSAHHAVHGNNNENVIIADVVFYDFEVAAVSLNNVKGLTIKHCKVLHNRHDVPVLGSFSALRQMLPYIEALKSLPIPYSMRLRGVDISSAEVYDAMVETIANVYRDVVETGFIDEEAHVEEFELFNNPKRVIDGPCYAFLVHGAGPAIGGVGFEMSEHSSELSTDVLISRNTIENVKCFTNEIPALVVDDAVQNDARGAVLQIVDTLTNKWVATDEFFHYIGNVMTDAQIMVANAIHDGVLTDTPMLQTKVNSISKEITSWASGSTATIEPHFRCNGDIMHHYVKGSIMIRVEGTKGFKVLRNTIRDVSVLSCRPAGALRSSVLLSNTPSLAAVTCADYHNGASPEDGDEQQLANLRGISVAAVSNFLANHDKNNGSKAPSRIFGNSITNLQSEFAHVIVGVDVQGISEGVLIGNNFVNLKDGIGPDPDDQFIACRLRKFSSMNNTIKANNAFAQEEVNEVFDATIFHGKMRRRQESTAKIPATHPAIPNGSRCGGCPFVSV